MTTRKFDRPEGWNFNTFRTSGGHTIRYGSARPARPSRGTVVVTGGYGRHIEFYYEMINNWRDRGYTVYAMDWHGMGGSDREDPAHPHRPPTSPFALQADILHEFTQTIVKPGRHSPAFLVSHSMGAHIALHYMHKYERQADYPYAAAIMAAPLIDFNTAMIPRRMLDQFVRAANYIGLDDMPMPSARKLYNDFVNAAFLKVIPTDAERDAANERIRRETVGISIGFPTAAWFAAALRSIRDMARPGFFDDIQTPTLLVTTEKDGLISVSAVERAALHMPHAAMVRLRDARHGLWYDGDRVQTLLWRAIDTFSNGICAQYGAAARPTLPPVIPPATPHARPLAPPPAPASPRGPSPTSPL